VLDVRDVGFHRGGTKGEDVHAQALWVCGWGGSGGVCGLERGRNGSEGGARGEEPRQARPPCILKTAVATLQRDANTLDTHCTSLLVCWGLSCGCLVSGAAGGRRSEFRSVVLVKYAFCLLLSFTNVLCVWYYMHV